MLGTPVDVVSAGAPTPAPAADPVQAGYAALLAEVLAVDTVDPDAHVFEDLGADSMVMARFCARVRKQPGLPPVSIKDVYQHPTVAGLARALAPAPAADPVQTGYAALLAEVLAVDTVDPDAHVFDDLGADSMVMARFCARVRKHPDLPPVSIKDVYQHPTVRALATALAPAPATAPAPAPVTAPEPAPVPAPRPAPADGTQHVLAGALQALFFLSYCMVVASVGVAGYDWISDGGSIVADYLRSVIVAGGTFVGVSVLPILVKWVFIGRWRAEEFPVWSLRYVRFWIVKTLVQKNPMVLLFAGTPVFTLYLRALGAKVGRDVAIFTRQVPVTTDLLTIGDGTVIRKDVLMSGYRAHHGMIQIAPITLGRDVVVGDASVLDIGTSMADGAQLGHRSSLHRGQVVPAGQSWHGCPGRQADVDYRLVPPARCSTRRKVVWTVLKVLGVLFVELPLAVGGTAMLVLLFPGLDELLDVGPLALASASFYGNVAIGSLVLYFGGILVSALFVTTVPRVLNLFITPDRVYPLYGFHYSVQRTITRMTTARYLLKLTGNSSYVVPMLLALGYHLRPVVQTGSNFGEAVKHDNPHLTSVGTGTMVADGLTVMNVEFSSTSFQVFRTSVGANSFLGNAIAYPPQSQAGDDVLLATKVMVPIDGPVRTGVGLLGSPAFEIPRTVERDATIDDHLQAPGELAQRLAAKNRHNLVTLVLFLTLRWTNFFGVTLITLAGFEFHTTLGALSIAASMVLTVVFTLLFGVLTERAVTRPMGPLQCSIYDPDFWRHERYWKVATQVAFLNGTPFKPIALRMLGARVGRQVFDDGSTTPERTLLTIGDRCTINAGVAIQCHSQEDGGFKRDFITIGSGVTLGVSSWVHYGVTMGDGSELAPDSFLMKGSEVEPGTRWVGNPAEEVRDAAPAALTAPPDDSHDDDRDDDRTGPRTQDVEDLMDVFRADDALDGDPLSGIPQPRRSGRHRAHGRHLARTR